MTNYVLLYSGGGMPETEEEQAAVMVAWSAWYAGMGEAIYDGGNPFTPMAKTVNSDGSVSDGDGGRGGSGYTVVSADSLDAAVELAKGCPILDSGGNVYVYETFVIEGT